MFEVFSQEKNRIVRIDEATEADRPFCCPNLRCPARFIMKSINGQKAAHFSRLSKTPHIDGCEYDTEKSKFHNSKNLHKSPIEEIYQNSIVGTRLKTEQGGTHHKKNVSGTFPGYIRTPNQLYHFCVSNPLDTEYLPGTTVNDILISSQNLATYGRPEELVGLRMIIGKTANNFPRGRFKDDMIALLVIAETENSKYYRLNVRIRMSPKIYEFVCNHVGMTDNKINKRAVAVFERWEEEWVNECFYISCRLLDTQHIIIL